MPVTRNVARDGRLESFKGRDTAQYVLTAASFEATCAACKKPLERGDALSLQRLIAFGIGGKILFQEQLHPDNPNDGLWLEAARGGRVLVVSGDNLIITPDGVDLRHAAPQGTLVAGTVSVVKPGDCGQD
jgi:hypothetical protein